uniref:Adhesion G protein-coupled receptor G3 n=1 Tax=Pundamilia nyererei TaxID=303518 RepID=A0A3B4GKS3_9CICH
RTPQIHRRNGKVFRDSAVCVRAGNRAVENLLQPITLTFKHNKEVKRQNGTCVFWKETSAKDGTGTTGDVNLQCYWSNEGCDTNYTAHEFICSCNHLSFFAVLWQTPLAMFCLHLTFLLSSLLAQLLKEKEDGSSCLVLGLVLHWSLLATMTWSALEGFHLYLLLIRVFNIYVRRYLLKLSLIGWGFPTLVAAVCGISRVYGKYTLKYSNSNLTQHIYITTVAFPFLVVVFNACMLGLVVFKMLELRRGDRSFGSSSDWKKINKERKKRLWKDCVTVLGLSCVLGLPWGLASTTYVSLAGIYIFTVLNSLQGYRLYSLPSPSVIRPTIAESSENFCRKHWVEL